MKTHNLWTWFQKMLGSKKGLSMSGSIGFHGPACGRNNADSMSECGKDKGSCTHKDDVYVKCEGTNCQFIHCLFSSKVRCRNGSGCVNPWLVISCYDKDVVVSVRLWFLADRVKLIKGKTPHEGIASYYDGKQWGTVCDKVFYKWGWPSVMCKELGYDSASASKLARKVTLLLLLILFRIVIGNDRQT